MRGTEARGGTAQVPVTGWESLRHQLSSRSRPAKAETEGPSIHVVPLNPSDRLTVLYGHPAASRIASQVLVDRALSGQPVVFLDGIHAFDAFIIGRLARSRRQQPRKVLAMIHVARAFSARQLERLMSQCLVGALERYQARTAVISGLLETLCAGGLTDHEVRRLTDRMIESVGHLTLQGFSLLCPCPSVPMPTAPAHRLFTILRSMSNRCIHVYEMHGKVVTEEIPLEAIPAYTEP
ncbi:MAG: hypothetical protein P0119_12065 [Nitrospira sp.]|nr:hypothetical protein [Nitrospira sp.]